MITSADRQLIYDNVIDRLMDDGLYVVSAQNRVKYFRNTFAVNISASPMGTSGTHSALEVIIDDLIAGITDYYATSAISISAFGFTFTDGLSADGNRIGIKYNPSQLAINGSGQLSVADSLTVQDLTVVNIINGLVSAVDGHLVGVPIPVSVTDHGDLTGLYDDDHERYVLRDPWASSRNLIINQEQIVSIGLQAYLGQSNEIFQIYNSDSFATVSVSASGNMSLLGSLNISGDSQSVYFSHASDHDILSLGAIRTIAQNLILETTTSNGVVFKPNGTPTFFVYPNSVSAVATLVIDPASVKVIYLAGPNEKLVYADNDGVLRDSGISANSVPMIRGTSDQALSGTSQFYAKFSGPRGLMNGTLKDIWSGTEVTGLTFSNSLNVATQYYIFENLATGASTSSKMIVKTYGIDDNSNASIMLQNADTFGWEVGTNASTSAFFISYNGATAQANNRFFEINTSGHASIGRNVVPISGAFLNLEYSPTVPSLSAGWISLDSGGIVVRGNNITGVQYGFLQGVADNEWGLGYKSSVAAAVGVSLIKWNASHQITLPSLSGSADRYVVVGSDGLLKTTSASIGSVSGSGNGTINTIAKFITSASVGDSLMSENGSQIFVNGNLKIANLNGILSAAGGVVVQAPTLPISVGGTNNNSGFTNYSFVWYNGTSLVSSNITSASFVTSTNGTPGKISKFITTNSLGDSLISELGPNISVSGNAIVSGVIRTNMTGGGPTAGMVVSAANPAMALNDSDAAVDNRWWDVIAVSEQLRYRVIDDANSSSNSYMTVDRTGIVIDNVTFPASVIMNSALNVSGTTRMSSDLLMVGPAKNIVFTHSSEHIISATSSLRVIGETGLSLETASSQISFKPASTRVMVLSSTSLSALDNLVLTNSSMRVNHLSGVNTRQLGVDSFGNVIIVGSVSAAVSGTPGRIPKFITPISIGDSLMSENGEIIFVSGSASITGALNVSGTQTNASYIQFTGLTAGTTGWIGRTALGGLIIQGITGSSHDLSIRNTNGNDLIRNPTGSSRMEFNGSGGVSAVGPVFLANALNVSGVTSLNSNLYAKNTSVSVNDNDTGVFLVAQGANEYIRLNTTNTSESLRFGNSSTNNNTQFLGTGYTSFGGSVVVSGGASVKTLANSLNNFVYADASGKLNLVTAISFLGGNHIEIRSTMNVSGATTFRVAPILAFAADRILYANSSGVISTTSILAYNGTNITIGSGNTIVGSTGAATLGSTLLVQGATTHNSQIYVRSGSPNGAINGTSTDRGQIVVGPNASQQIQLDVDEIQSMNNTTPSNMYINRNGGDICTNVASGGIIIGEAATPVGLLDVRARASGNVIAMFGAASTVSPLYPGYIYISQVNTINAGYNVNGNADLWINYTGYQNGHTQFRDLAVYDGKGVRFVHMDGSSKRLILNNSTVDDGVGTLQVNGKVYGNGGFYNNVSYTAALFNAENSSIAYFQANDGATVNVRLAPGGHSNNWNYFRRPIHIGASSDVTSLGSHVSLMCKENASSTFIQLDKDSTSYECGLMFADDGSNKWFVYMDNDSNNYLQIQANDLAGENDSTPRIRLSNTTTDIWLAGSGGNIRIGDVQTPSAKLDITSDSSIQTDLFIRNYSNDPSSAGGVLHFRRYRGTQASPAITVANDAIGTIRFGSGGGGGSHGTGTTTEIICYVTDPTTPRSKLLVQSDRIELNSIFSGISLIGSLEVSNTSVGSSRTLTNSDLFVYATSTCTLTFPAISSAGKRAYVIAKHFSGGQVRMETTGSDSIYYQGSTLASITMTTNGTCLFFVSDGTSNWVVFNYNV